MNVLSLPMLLKWKAIKVNNPHVTTHQKNRATVLALEKARSYRVKRPQ